MIELGFILALFMANKIAIAKPLKSDRLVQLQFVVLYKVLHITQMNDKAFSENQENSKQVLRIPARVYCYRRGFLKFYISRL